MTDASDDGVPYRPVDCSLHDRLLDWATRRRPVRITYAGTGGAVRHTQGVIEDVLTRAGAEFLRLADGREIRLDRLLRVEEA